MKRALGKGWLVLLAVAGLAACEPTSTAAPPAGTASAGGGAGAEPPPAPPPPAAAVARRWPFADAVTGAESGAVANVAVTPATLMASNYYVVFDASGSMSERQCSGNESKLDVAKRAFAEFADKVPTDANFGLTVFGSRAIEEIVPLGRLDRATVKAAVAGVYAGGRTPLSESIDRAYQALTQQGRRQLGYGEYHLIVVTDGESTDGNPQAVVDRLLNESPVILHTIGFCLGDTHSLNQPGRVLYRQAGNAAELAEGFVSVLAEAPSFDVQSFQ